MRLPWQKACPHDIIHIARFDHGIDKRIVLSCADCKEPLGEQMGQSLFLDEEDTPDVD